ncbi:transposase [Pedobacter sp. JCM 36344]|uniref:transposase n=1 Tax=Pedobacter sp. JCM 36344 TaxID=3374280 RepID=UPI00397BB77D
MEAFRTVARSIQLHYLSILNFFINRSINALAESFNAKVKAYRATPIGLETSISFFSNYQKSMLKSFLPRIPLDP